MSDASESMQAPKSKRQKVDVACDSCRSKKIKCDGRHPVCQPCEKKIQRGAKCTWFYGLGRLGDLGGMGYVQSPPRASTCLTPPNASTTLRPETEIQMPNMGCPLVGLPSPIEPRDTQLSSSTAPTDTPPGASQSAEPLSLLRNHAGTAGVSETLSHKRFEAARGPEPHSSSEHSVHAIIGATLPKDNQGFYGNSSAGSFIQHVQKMVEHKVYGVSEQPNHRNVQAQVPSSRKDTQQVQIEYILPSRRRADALLSIYWTNVYTLYPYLDKAQILGCYEEIWKAEGFIPDEKSYMCLINIIFALASQLDSTTPPHLRHQTAHQYYTRGRELLDIVDAGSIRNVQALLLLGQYFQSTSEPHPCWIFTGLAIRVAQSLGLHLLETSERAADGRTRELMRKVWHGCILMDRVVAMTYGRPCMVGSMAAATVPLPLPVDEDYLAGESYKDKPAPPGRQGSTVEFFVHSLKLYGILHDVIFGYNYGNAQPSQLQLVESNSLKGSPDQSQSSMFEIERRLQRWKESIPDGLRLPAASGQTSTQTPGSFAEATLYRQAVVLQQRQLHVRLMLLRPGLSSYITSELQEMDRPDEPGDSSLAKKVLLQCAVECVQVAFGAIDILHRTRSIEAGDMSLSAEWWYNVLYLYTSATVLICARLSSAVLSQVSEKLVLDSWQKAMHILEGYTLFGPAIASLTVTLGLLFDAVPQQYSRLRESTRQSRGNTPQAPPGLLHTDNDFAVLATLRDLDAVERFPDSLGPGPVIQREAEREEELSLPPAPDEGFHDFDGPFDPNDFSWLINIPLEN